jgi:hypothetical protein
MKNLLYGCGVGLLILSALMVAIDEVSPQAWMLSMISGIFLIGAK